VLQADLFQVYNSHFGTNANIAARILLNSFLPHSGQGQLPSSVSKETPFIRSSEEIQNLSSPSGISPSKLAGVFRVKKVSNGEGDSSFGVAVPQFYVSCDGCVAPKVATVNKQPLLLCIGIDDENDAGKLFSFCYRVFYGSNAVADILAERNPDGELPPGKAEFGPINDAN